MLVVPVGVGGKMVEGTEGDDLGVFEIVGELDGVVDEVAVIVDEGEAPKDKAAVGVGVFEGAEVELKLIVGDAVVPIVEVGVVEDPTVDDGVLVVLTEGVDDADVPAVAVVVDVTDTVGVTDGDVERVGSTVVEVLELNFGVDDIDPEVVIVGDGVGVVDDDREGTADGST